MSEQVSCWWCFKPVVASEHDFFGCMNKLRGRRRVATPKVPPHVRVPEPTLFEEGA